MLDTPYNRSLRWQSVTYNAYTCAILRTHTHTRTYTQVQVIQLDEDRGEFVLKASFDHPYPTTKMMWIPDQVPLGLARKGSYPSVCPPSLPRLLPSSLPPFLPSPILPIFPLPPPILPPSSLQTGQLPDLVATAGDYLRLWRVTDSDVRQECMLNNVSWLVNRGR